MSIHKQKDKLWELRKWPSKEKRFVLIKYLSNFEEIGGDQSWEFILGYWALKKSHEFKVYPVTLTDLLRLKNSFKVYFAVSDWFKSHEQISFHNQPPLTKLEDGCDMRKMTSIAENNRQKIGRQPGIKSWGRVCVVLHTLRVEEIAELLLKEITRKARIKLDGWHLLFEGYVLD